MLLVKLLSVSLDSSDELPQHLGKDKDIIKNFGLNELTEKSYPFELVRSEADSKAQKASKNKQNKITKQIFLGYSKYRSTKQHV